MFLVQEELREAVMKAGFQGIIIVQEVQINAIKYKYIYLLWNNTINHKS